MAAPAPARPARPSSEASPGEPAPRPTRSRKALGKALALGLSLLVSAALMEGVFRFIEWRDQAKVWSRGVGGYWARDDRWGWRMTQGDFEIGGPEFVVKGSINALWMNDPPVDADAERSRTRVLALGDSHTYAVGVSLTESWPRVLEGELAARNSAQGTHAFRVYNTGTAGYNLHQYLLRLIDQGPLVKPDYVVVGFSYATDLYDLLPPAHGGWAYGWPDQPRDYFDLDDAGVLVERRDVPSLNTPRTDGGDGSNSRLRLLASRSAAIRYLHRSNLGLAIGSRISVGGQPLWANVEIVVEKELRPEHAYAWRLAQALLLRMRDESERQHAKLIVAGIPYLPQVYDEVWNVTFAGKPAYSPTAAIERMQAFCAANGIPYVDTRDALRKKTQEVGRWLHYRKDAHPTPEGQAVIARAIADAGVIAPVR